MESLRSGDPAAPGLLLNQFHAVIHRASYRMLRHQQDAEDVVQETFHRALKGIHRFDASRPLRPWLLGIAINRCRTALSKRARRPAPSPLLADVPDHRPDGFDADELSRELERSLDKLRPDYRTVFILFHDQELPYEEIAQIMNRPVGTIKTWLHRARAELAEDLGRRGIRC